MRQVSKISLTLFTTNRRLRRYFRKQVMFLCSLSLTGDARLCFFAFQKLNGALLSPALTSS